MPVKFWFDGTKFGKSSKVSVKLPCCPHTEGVAEADDAEVVNDVVFVVVTLAKVELLGE